MNYNPEKLSQAKTRYQTAMEEAQASLLILILLERAGGEMTCLALAEALVKQSPLCAYKDANALCGDLCLEEDEMIRLTDDLLDFGLEELL